MRQNQKEKGQVFTPEYMVNAMLDWCGYQGMIYYASILRTTVVAMERFSFRLSDDI